MKNFSLLFTGFLGLALHAVASDAPRGSLLELHSCEVYAGPCVVSSESPQEGRYMVRAWDFAGGKFNGADLSGLQVAVLQSSADNLAEAGANSGEAIVYLPKAATQIQRDALLAWLKASQTDLRSAKFQTRIAPLQFTKSENGYAFSAGDFVSVKTAALSECAMGNCGESVWYQPRAATSIFTVAVNSSSKVSEPLLKLKWSATGNRSIFLARFGETIPSKNLYVSIAELCGPTRALF
jgi:hypothetical protein